MPSSLAPLLPNMPGCSCTHLPAARWSRGCPRRGIQSFPEAGAPTPPPRPGPHSHAIAFGLRLGLRHRLLCRYTALSRILKGLCNGGFSAGPRGPLRYSSPHTRLRSPGGPEDPLPAVLADGRGISGSAERCATGMAPKATPHGFGTGLSPQHLRPPPTSLGDQIRILRRVAASKPTAPASTASASLSHCARFPGLIHWSGLFPSRPRNFSSKVCLDRISGSQIGRAHV